jgi:hypothetical protein
MTRERRLCHRQIAAKIGIGGAPAARLSMAAVPL